MRCPEPVSRRVLTSLVGSGIVLGFRLFVLDLFLEVLFLLLEHDQCRAQLDDGLVSLLSLRAVRAARAEEPAGPTRRHGLELL